MLSMAHSLEVIQHKCNQLTDESILVGAFESPASIIETNTVVMSPDNYKYPKCIYNMDFLLDVSIHGEGFEAFEGLYACQ